MMMSLKQPRLIAATGVLIGLAACSNNSNSSKASNSADAELQRDLAAVAGSSGDLQLAPRSAQSQMVVSPIEGGPSAAPAPAKRTVTPKPTPRVATPRASAPRVAVRAPAPAPRATVIEAPAPAPVEAIPAPAPREVEPPPLRPARQGPATQQKGTYKTEAEIFRQMPWIKP